MEILALIFVKLLDPIGLIVCFVILLKLRDKWWSTRRTHENEPRSYCALVTASAGDS